MWRVSTLAVVLLCLRLSGSEDLYWRPNTDWSNPSNWALGRAPCPGDVADLSSVPRGSVIKLDGNTTVRSVVLPVGSTILLGSSVSLRLSDSTTCEVQTASGPMVAEVKEDNTFVGAGPKYWECPQNWKMKDGGPAKTAPCGSDRAIFEEGHHYHTVESNATSVSVQYLRVRGKLVTTELIKTVAPEFKLNLSVVPACGEEPSLCPCLTDCLAPEHTKKDEALNNRSGRTAGIVVAVLVAVLLVVALTVIIIVLWLRWRRKNGPTPYMKDDLIGEPDDNITRSDSREGALFDNPIYEVDVSKKPSGSEGSKENDVTTAHEMATIAILRPSDYEPVEYTPASIAADEGSSTPPDECEKKVPVLNEYERLS